MQTFGAFGTGWHLGNEKPEWATKANFIDTVQDPDGLVWHIFGVLPEEQRKKKKQQLTRRTVSRRRKTS